MGINRIKHIIFFTVILTLAACSSDVTPTPELAAARVPTNTPLPPTDVPPTSTPEPTAIPTQVPMEEIEEGLLQLTAIEQFQVRFNQDQGQTRMVLFLSTGCPTCLSGAQWINNTLLTDNPDAQLVVYAIWFPTVASDQLLASTNTRWERDLMDDVRIVNMWDEKRVASRWFAQNQPYEGPDRASLPQTFGNLKWGRAVWDIYFLYGADATWDEMPDSLVSSGYPLLGQRANIREALDLSLAAIATDGDILTLTFDSSETIASYGVGETLAGRDFNYAIGSTNQVSGEIILSLQNPSLSEVSTITINLKSLASENFLRDERLQQEYLESHTYPTATFTPTELTGLPDSYELSQSLTFQMTGELTVKETSLPVTFEVEARFEDGRLIGVATAQILMSDFGVTPPQISNLIAAEDEVDLRIEFVAVPTDA